MLVTFFIYFLGGRVECSATEIDVILMGCASKLTECRLPAAHALMLLLLFATTLMPYVIYLHTGARKSVSTLLRGEVQPRTEDAPLPFVTLSFDFGDKRPMLEHNCAFLSQNGHTFDIYTDITSHPYCKVCNCIQFVPSNCTCPKPDRRDCSLCEKLAFIVKLMGTREEIVFIDSDLLLLRQEFLPALKARTEHFDFLASYGFGSYDTWKYSSPFNSGLMFMRRLQGLDYELLMKMMVDMNGNNDQNIISAFVRQFYARRDTLSLQWHCRMLNRPEHNINFDDCFTFHGRDFALRSAVNESRSNFTYLHTQ